LLLLEEKMLRRAALFSRSELAAESVCALGAELPGERRRRQLMGI
jgi:hypothetical protein